VKQLGEKGEDIAAAYLKGKGYAILHRNYRTPVGEADIIAKDGTTIVFVEVKARATLAFGRPFEAVNARKIEKIRRVALYYLKQAGREQPLRFDVVSIHCERGKAEVDHIRDAFSF
jgi:putative endonuclease